MRHRLRGYEVRVFCGGVPCYAVGAYETAYAEVFIAW
jgi:hypothetical protein